MTINTDKKYIAVIDYGMGNLFSVQRACEYAGTESIITHNKKEIINADGAILPGVGAFGDAMANLQKLDLIYPIKEFITSGKPFLGICLGMQLLMSESEEFGINKGLNIIGGQVTKFSNFNDKNNKIRVPHIGWNRIFLAQNPIAKDSILYNIRDGEFMYFVHSFFAVPQEEEVAITYTDYCGIRYCSGIRKNNLVAFQFHPEKSGPLGIQIFKNFKEIICKDK